jgi:hypothetical protein
MIKHSKVEAEQRTGCERRVVSSVLKQALGSEDDHDNGGGTYVGP